ncbi:hypothetical protein [Desulfosporosinus nitroreducens]|uniref:Cytochrome c domain-containing protein n=1 Tax=Desulfosporosinus nitroreducens TaxID=2018668 RepID=A0ABT8QPS7_9FIRM|nr:hypothetical protein [Desulfosporosinus nitroreducens]MDO0823331.1 hypothetical protein [Desulfosporosinus nitroreducens]
MAKGFSTKIATGITLMMVGTAIGLSAMSSYAQPMPKENHGGREYLTFQLVCTTCHEATTVQNSSGTESWSEVITQMRGFGAFVTEDQTKEIEDYLQKTYPR